MSKAYKDLLNQLKSSLSKAGSEPEPKAGTPAPVTRDSPHSATKPTNPTPRTSSDQSDKSQNKPRKASKPENRPEVRSKPKPSPKPGNRTPPAPSPNLKPSSNPEKKDKSNVVSITLYPRDLDHIDRIIDYMRDNQSRITRSEAIKLALRGVSLNRQMLDIYPKIQGEDGRRK